MFFERIDRVLHRVHHALLSVEETARNVRTIMGSITDLNQRIADLADQVAKSVEVEKSALTLIQGINAELAAAGTDAAKLADLRASLMGSAEALSMAVAANTGSTPAVPATPPPPAPSPTAPSDQAATPPDATPGSDAPSGT